jgi:hypothetical protein
MYENNASNDFDEIFFQELLRIFNVHRASKDENDVFSKRDDYNAYFWIILNKFN